MDSRLLAEVEDWIADDPDPVTAHQLRELVTADNEKELAKYFSGFLQFGTAGLRGPIGPGPSCMNRAVVGRTAAGLAKYMQSRGMTSVVIGRDARHGSEDYTQETAEIMSGAGMKVFILPRPLPTPVLAFAIGELGVDIGVMVTASHNPPQDNGYKVYVGPNADGIEYRGSQIISPTDGLISKEIDLVTSLAREKRGNSWTILDETIIEKYIHKSAKLATSPGDLKIVYTAMHGVGTETIQRVFHSAGFGSLILVDAQAQPDPDFPTVAFPNPEEPGAIDLALETARNFDADLVIANDPDADRCAAAVKDPSTGWRMLRGDELGALLGEYIARKNPSGVFANSIVSSSILKKIAEHYKIEYRQTLTGFKWLAKIPQLAFGYEEALGYCVDSESVNDKDGISAALLLAQLATDLSLEGMTLLDLLDEIWLRHGFHATEQISLRVSDLSKIQAMLTALRATPPSSIAGKSIRQIDDLMKPADDLPPTDGIRIWLEENIRIIIRPSGTEAKVKCYVEVITHGDDAKIRAAETIALLKPALTEMVSRKCRKN